MQAIKYNELYFVEHFLTSAIETIDCLPNESELHYDDDNFEEIANKMGILANNTTYALTENATDLEQEGRISLAYEKLTSIPKQIADRFAARTLILDLSHNYLSELGFLSNFKRLNSLILDKNPNLNENTLPYLPNLQLFWLNHCDITNLTKWIKKIQMNCPNLKYLSLLGNPGALSLFNGSTIFEHNDYRMYVIGQLPSLCYLDDQYITSANRAQAKSHRYLYSLASAFHIIGGGQNKNSRKNKLGMGHKIEIYEYTTTD